MQASKKGAKKDMGIKIGHASIDENGKIAGGSAGDQTLKEVCIREWYNKGWNCVLRPKTAALAEKSAVAMEQACANNNIGYDQWQRNTLYAHAKAYNFDLSKITTKCECDCSSLAHVCSIVGGANLSYGSNGHTTRTMRAAYKASGDYEILTDSKYLTSDKYLKRGDLLLKEGSHVAMALESGSAVSNNTKKGSGYMFEPSLVKKDSNGASVLLMQTILRGKGYKGKDGKELSLDAECGTNSEYAINAYQTARRKQGVEIGTNGKNDGLCGNKMWADLIGL